MHVYIRIIWATNQFLKPTPIWERPFYLASGAAAGGLCRAGVAAAENKGFLFGLTMQVELQGHSLCPSRCILS